MAKASVKTKEGLSVEAFAIIGDPAEPETWQLPHHKKAVTRALAGKIDIEETVDWEGIKAAVSVLSPRNMGSRRLETSPGEIIMAARHLAGHYQRSGKPLPDVLAAIV